MMNRSMGLLLLLVVPEFVDAQQSFPISELAVDVIYASKVGDSNVFCLLGGNTCLLRVANNPWTHDALIDSWLAAHPKAVVTRISSHTMALGGNRPPERQVYVWIEDGGESLNVELVRRRDGDEEITRNDPPGVQAQERRPSQVPSRPTLRSIRQIFAHRSGRDLNSQLHQQFIGDALLAPRCIPVRHPANQSLNLKWNRRPTRSGLQPPEQFPSRSVPTDHRLGAYHYERIPPVEES
jgi:hypothetical protein